MTTKNSQRDIDIGCRARKLPFWLGRHGQLKYELIQKFVEVLPAYPEYNVDIQDTGTSDNDKNVLNGYDWIRFLLRCRTVVGCLGGSGLMDPDGSIVVHVNRYCADHPDASFEEVEQACFPGQDGKIHLCALSPRHFECAVTKTCQILMEGDYGVFRPGIHYIELKKDYSNLNDVLKTIGDKAICEKIAQRCYDDIVNLSFPFSQNRNTYAWFANYITDYLVKRTNDDFNGGRPPPS
ncbi:MAG: hypothetical protein LBG80_16395 [Bacteroidales bacterium]|jgi:hypothetical protein|nr:hypothetical protein [Bacteroidales bacterium]